MTEQVGDDQGVVGKSRNRNCWFKFDPLPADMTRPYRHWR